MGTGQSCDDDERSNCEQASGSEGEGNKDERNDQNETSSEQGEAFDSFLTAILHTPPDKLPPVEEEKE